MTGWRVGWMVLPERLLADVGKLIEFNSTCSPAFVQRAATHAIANATAEISADVARLKLLRDHLWNGLAAVPGITTAPPPQGAMYAFFKVNDMTDSLSFARNLLATAKLGLAPGIAFGPEGEGFLRWCFASGTEKLDAGIERLRQHLRHQAAHRHS